MTVGEVALQDIRGALRASASEASWGRVAAGLGIPKATLWRFCQDGYEPKKPEVRRALGLPVDPIILAEARLCACRCGTAFIPRTVNQVRIPGHPRRREARPPEITAAG